MFTAIDSYIARKIAVPLVSNLVIAALLLVLDKMQRLFDFVASEGGPVSVVWRMLANLLPEYLSLGIPIGLLLGILMAFRGLSMSSELDVFRAVGLSYWRLLRVPMLFALFFAGINLIIVGYLAPQTRYAYEELRFELRSGALGASIKVGEFANLGKRMMMRIEQSENGGKRLNGIFVSALMGGGNKLSAAAEHGQFLRTDDPDTIILRLSNGVLVHDVPKNNQPRTLTFTSHDLPIPLPKTGAFRSRGGRETEWTLPELVRNGTDEKLPEIQRLKSLSNFHYRMVEVAMMFLLPFLALAMAVPPKRSSSALGVFLAIVMVVAYHKINEYATSMGELGLVDPTIALWGPFLIFAGIIAWMYHILAHRPGGQPIGAVETAFGKLSSRIRKLFTRARPLEEVSA